LECGAHGAAFLKKGETAVGSAEKIKKPLSLNASKRFSKAAPLAPHSKERFLSQDVSVPRAAWVSGRCFKAAPLAPLLSRFREPHHSRSLRRSLECGAHGAAFLTASANRVAPVPVAARRSLECGAHGAAFQPLPRTASFPFPSPLFGVRRPRRRF
jgi:hypothetical protein